MSGMTASPSTAVTYRFRAPERLDEATLAARAAGLRQRNAPLFLILRREGGVDAVEGALAPLFARARERGTPSYRVIEYWPFR